MNRKLSLVYLMKSVMNAMGEGRGLASAVVENFTGTSLSCVARDVLLGMPASEALARLGGECEETAMLVSMASGTGFAGTRSLGARGKKLSASIEGWLRAEESWRAEMGVLKMRGLIVAVITGAVCATIAGLGPLLGSFGLTAPPQQAGEYLMYASFSMSVISGFMLGLFVWPGRAYIFGLAAALSFGAVAAGVAPLASLQLPSVGWTGLG